MKKKGKTLTVKCQNGTKATSSRDAVETAIDKAKTDKSCTWEQSLKNSKIPRWEELAKPFRANA
jgi:hypothetical protein